MKNRNNIEQLYDLYEEEMQRYIVDEEVLNLSRKVIEKQNEFEASLTEEQKTIYEDYMELRNKRDALLDKNVFVYAYSLSAQLLTEALSNNVKADVIQ